MKLSKIRIVVSGFFFIGFTLLFAGPERLTFLLSEILLPLQFVPALIRTIFNPAAGFVFGLILIAFVTLAFGRVYCSFCCPLGTTQDLLSALGRKLRIRKNHAYTRPHNFLRYTILFMSASALAVGYLSVINLLDPFAIAGRFFSQVVQPLVVAGYNLAIRTLKIFDIYWYPKQGVFVFLPSLAVTACFLGFIAYLSMKHGRLYCNTLCPVGTLLGLASRYAFFKWSLDSKSCSECVRCEKVCKSDCIDSQTGSVDMSRCVGCFNCLDTCLKNAITFRKTRRKSTPGVWSPARRSFVAGSAVFAGGLLWTFNPALRDALASTRLRTRLPVTPPGSRGVSHFTEACTACSLCISACPTKVLTPSFMDYGPEGLLQPKMNYDKSFCDYECNICSRVCPTGAITPIGLDDKKLVQIAEASLLEDVCVVFVRHTNCGACGEVCPTHAIRFVDKNNILYPEIDKKYCIGCGSCRLACPTQPRSIDIQSHPVHKKAEKNMTFEKSPPKEQPSSKDFPF